VWLKPDTTYMMKVENCATTWQYAGNEQFGKGNRYKSEDFRVFWR